MDQRAQFYLYIPQGRIQRGGRGCQSAPNIFLILDKVEEEEKKKEEKENERREEEEEEEINSLNPTLR